MSYKVTNIHDQDQRHSVKTSCDRKIITLFQEIGVTESKIDVRILIRSSEIAVGACAVQIWPKQPRMTGATSCGLQVVIEVAIATFSSC